MTVAIQTGVQQSFGATGCPFGSETALQLAAGGTNTPARGEYMVVLSPNDSLQYTPDAGVTYRTIYGDGGTGRFYTDGFNVRILNNGNADLGAVYSYLTQIKKVG